MTRGERIYLAVAGAVVLFLGYQEAVRPKPVDWNPNYSRYKRTPYGAQLVYDRLPDLFRRGVRTVEAPIGRTAASLDTAAAPVLHLFVNTVFDPGRPDQEGLLARVEQGDAVLIAAEQLGIALLDTLGTAMSRTPASGDKVTLRFLTPGSPGHAYAAAHATAAWTPTDSTWQVLAVNGRSEPVFMSRPWGRGRIWLCSVPVAITNLGLLENGNDRFMADLLTALPELPVLWDERYKVGRRVDDTPMRWVIRQSSLNTAFRLALALVLLHMLFRSKREQRPIPVLAPLRNTTREFVRTVAMLYLAKAEHAALARRMITYFKEDVRQLTYLRHFENDAATAAHLARKAGMPEGAMRKHLDRLDGIARATHLSEIQLLQLSDELNDLRTKFRH